MLTKQAREEFLRSRVRLRPKTMKGYDLHLKRFEEFSPELPQVPQPIRDFLNSLEAGDETAHGHWRSLRAMYREVTTQHPKINNPMPQVKAPRRMPKVMRTLSPQQLCCLLGQPLSLRDSALLKLLLDSGIRAGEAASLLWENVYPEFVIVSGKTGERAAPISLETHRALIALSSGQPTSHVFIGKRGPLSYEGVYKAVHKACVRAGLTGKRASPHTLRHSYGTLMIVAGCDLVTVQKALGHSDIRVTQKYVHQDILPLIQKHRQFSPLKLMHAAAQGVLFEDEVLKAAEALLAQSRREDETGRNPRPTANRDGL